MNVTNLISQALTLFIIIPLLVMSCNTSNSSLDSKGLTVEVVIPEDQKENIKPKGRLFLFITTNTQSEPRTQLFPNPWALPYHFAINLDDFGTTSNVTLDSQLEWSKTTDFNLDELPDGKYAVQVLWDQDFEESRIDAPGNVFSKPQEIEFTGIASLEFQLTEIIPERELVQHELVKEVTFKSDTLSKFWNKPMELKASLLLPSNYDNTKAYPIRYNVAGYGGRYTRVERLINDEEFMNWWTSDDTPQVINVFLDGEGPFGDSYQMDSDNSGPYGYSLIYELIPYIENTYRNTNTSKTRFVDGCSTGGWVSLGLQLYYPDQFNGVFSYSPDAIEFENYQLTNIYKDKNMYTNEFGYLRPCMRDTYGEPLMSMKTFTQFENVQGYSGTYLDSGDQFSAHTALYSPRGENGLPKPLFNPITGDIDAEVAEHWKKYDFKLYLKENWDNIGEKLQGKIYIWMGDMDHFYLNMATRAFDDFIQTTTDPKSDAVIEFTPMQGHCSYFNHRRVLEQIQERLDKIAQSK